MGVSRAVGLWTCPALPVIFRPGQMTIHQDMGSGCCFGFPVGLEVPPCAAASAALVLCTIPSSKRLPVGRVITKDLAVCRQPRVKAGYSTRLASASYNPPCMATWSLRRKTVGCVGPRWTTR